MVEFGGAGVPTMFAGVLLAAACGVVGGGCSADAGDAEAEAGAADAAPTPDPEPASESEPAADEPEPEAGIRGFSWVSDALAGLPHPGSATELSDNLAWLSDQGIDAIVSLTEEPLPDESMAAHSLRSTHIPIPDGTAPTPEQIDEFIALVVAAKAQDESVAVHCLAGLGRTGTMLAAWSIYEGMSTEEALAKIREQRPGSVETTSQEEALLAYERRLRGAGRGAPAP